MKIGDKVFIPKGNAGKGCIATISHIQEDPICSLVFCEEFTEGLLSIEVETLEERLQTILDTMDVPELRKKDYHWLKRNLGIRNSENPLFKGARLILNHLKP